MDYITAKDMWILALGSGGLDFEWWRSFRFVKGDWDTPGTISLKVMNPENPETTITKEVTSGDIRRAWKKACDEGYVDCCTRRPVKDIGDDWDACVADLILQIAVFGEEIYA